ncbi:right-handed parallel beta-helix repeat-containing protein [Luteolibacter sp. SL250]|uniref:right-handed parallel beta-helix repeat-containing protein n=1 Tax=Luteolibacter sp. SL250 TaxID=2995170 RepID=UPI00226E8B6C|nr:right-handed parallel beta-helix repeat-containing protein [Luteolibacter sp. SL250]WAC21218.1 right-handed parallel beta-helix repeat-containing protein [Luteolibacter sp. SL250]
MTLSDARKTLGLGPDDDPRPFLNEFKEARERIAEMVRTAPNDILAERYQKGLVDFDQALAAVREHLEAVGLLPRPSGGLQPAPEVESPPAATIPPVAANPVPPATGEPAQPVTAEEIPPPPAPLPTDAEAVALPLPTPPTGVAVESASPPAPQTPPETPAVAVAPPPAPETPVPASPPAGKPAPEKPAFIFERAESLPPSAPPLPQITDVSDDEAEDDVPVRGSKRAARVAWLLTVILLCIAGMMFYLKREEDLRLQKLEEVIELGKKGYSMIENRRWPEAARIFDQIEKLNPESSLLTEGRAKIAAGIAEEDSQFIGFLTGQAKASLEAKRWDEATASAQQVLDRFPNEKEATSLLKQIAEGKALEADRLTLASARDMLQQRKWDDAISAANKILASRPGDDDAEALLADATAARDKAAADIRKARELLGQARARDKGQFDQAILDLLREASLLSPEDPEIKAQLEKLSSYARTIRVPGDFATPAEALAKARDRDRVIIAAGTWEGPLVVTAAIDLQGAGPDTTIVQCAAQDGSPITLAANAKGARVTGFSFRHESFDPGEERYSAGLVRGVAVDFVDCRFQDASGHGLAVIEGGHAIINRCRFADNGWNGVAASGPGTLLEVRESESLRNFGHGIESWDGAAIILVGNRCDDNSANGVHADNGGGSVSLEKNQFSGNREFGVVLSSAGSGRATGNTARNNLLGGFAIRAPAAGVAFSGNEASKNTGPGLILDIGLTAASYSGNTNVGNLGQQVLLNANLTVKDEPAPEKNAETPPKATAVPEDQ